MGREIKKIAFSLIIFGFLQRTPKETLKRMPFSFALFAHKYKKEVSDSTEHFNF
jgi:hypothetical protein